MSESQATDTKKREVVPAEGPDPFVIGLEAEVLNGLGVAIRNAVQAQQQLFVAGQAGFTDAVVRRLATAAGPSEPVEGAAGATSPAEDLEGLAARLGDTLPSARAPAGHDPAESTRRLMAAFAESLDLLSAVHAQQMMGYVRVLVALGFDYQGKELGPAASKALEEVFDGDAVVQLLAALAAERRGSATGPARG